MTQGGEEFLTQLTLVLLSLGFLVLAIQLVYAVGSGRNRRSSVSIQSQRKLAGCILGHLSSAVMWPSSGSLILLQRSRAWQQLLAAIARFNEATRRLPEPTNEREFQDQLWVIVKTLFEDAKEELADGDFAAVGNRPDFQIRSLGILLDAKFISADGTRGELGRYRKEVSEKLISYKQDPRWLMLLIVFYDSARILSRHPDFVRDFNSQKGIRVEVIR